jgi:uncharacterized small protein (DUF1192 family)
MVDLSKFVGKEVRVTFRNGCEREVKVRKSIWYGLDNKTFCLSEKPGSPMYNSSGVYLSDAKINADIIHIEEIKSMNRYEDLEKQVAEMQKEIDRLKAENKKQSEITIETAVPGDVLEDGSIVVHKANNMALLSAPATTEDYCRWSKEFTPVFEVLKSQGFNPSQWFIPSKEQLQLAYTNCRKHFTRNFYWSSTEVSSTNACCLFFTNGFFISNTKSGSLCVRAFRCVSF